MTGCLRARYLGNSLQWDMYVYPRSLLARLDLWCRWVKDMTDQGAGRA